MSEKVLNDVVAYQKSARLSPLDALRGIAACGVAFVYHWIWLFGTFDPTRLSAAPGSSVFILHWLYNYGQLFVELFFVISGFIFVHTYYSNVSKGLVGAREFYLKRLARLWPLMLFSSTLLFGIQVLRVLFGEGLFFVGVPVTLSDYILSLFFMQAAILSPGLAINGPAWSLSCEVLMYVLFFLLATRSKLRLDYFLMGCGFFILVGMAISRLGFEVSILNSMIARALVGFFSGALFYFVNKRYAETSVKKSRAWRLWLQLVVVLLLILVALLGIELGAEFLGYDTATYCLFIFPATIFLALNFRPLSWLLSLRFFQFFGEISYSIYLMNFPLIALFVSLAGLLHLTPDFYSKKVLLVFVIFSVFFSYLTYKFVERPANSFLRGKFKV